MSPAPPPPPTSSRFTEPGRGQPLNAPLSTDELTIPPASVEDLGRAPTTMAPAADLTDPSLAHALDPGAALAGSKAYQAQHELAPLPISPPPGFFGGLPYFFTVLGGRLRRGRVVKDFRREMALEEKQLAELHRDLGKRAWELGLSGPALDEELAALQALESQRLATEANKTTLGRDIQAEEERVAAIESDCQTRLSAAQAEIAAEQETLRQRSTTLRQAKAELEGQERQLRTLSASRDSKRGQATKAKDPEGREELERTAAELAVEIGDLEREREQSAARVKELEGPVAETTAVLAAARQRQQQAQKELTEARQALARVKREVGAEARQQGLEVGRIEQALAQKFLEVGRILDANRQPRPELEELYGWIGQRRQGLAARQEQIGKLELDQQTYDRAAFGRGKLLLGLGLGTLVLASVTLVLLFIFLR